MESIDLLNSIDSPTHRLTLLTQFIRLTDSQRLTTTHIDSHRLTTTHENYFFITLFEIILTFSISVILFSFSFYSEYILDEIYAVLKVIQLILTLAVLYISPDFLYHTLLSGLKQIAFLNPIKFNFFSSAQKQQGKVSQLHLSPCNLSQITRAFSIFKYMI